MTGQPAHGTPIAGQQSPGGWRECLPELIITATLVTVTGIAVYAYAGLPATAVILVGSAAVLLALVRTLVPWHADARYSERAEHGEASVIGFWQQRGALIDASASLARYDARLRTTLQHLLAAKLAEKHDINLYHDPVAARQVFLPDAEHDQLWFWVNPQRPAELRFGNPGIPQPTLAAILDRLEQL